MVIFSVEKHIKERKFDLCNISQPSQQ